MQKRKSNKYERQEIYMKLKRIITTMFLTLTLMVTTMMPTFAASNVDNFSISFKG